VVIGTKTGPLTTAASGTPGTRTGIGAGAGKPMIIGRTRGVGRTISHQNSTGRKPNLEREEAESCPQLLRYVVPIMVTGIPRTRPVPSAEKKGETRAANRMDRLGIRGAF